MKVKIVTFFIVIFCLNSVLFLSVSADEEQQVTRIELANYAMETYEYVTQEFIFPIAEREKFTDVEQSKSPLPYQHRVLQVYLNGFMYGTDDDKFSPDEFVSKAQVATVLYRVVRRLNQRYDISLEAKDITVSDLELSPEWSREAICYMVSVDLMTSNLNGTFCPNDTITHDELDRIVEKIRSIYVSPDDTTERIDIDTYLRRWQQN